MLQEYKLPDSALTALDYPPDQLRPYTTDALQTIYAVTMGEIALLQATLPYHNQEHEAEVVERTAVTLQATQLPPLDRALAIHAAIGHDYGHPGSTIRQTVESDIPRKDLSNEEYAAEATVEIAEDNGLRLPKELEHALRNLILATSFGQRDPGFAYFRPYKPITPAEKVLAYADIANFDLDPLTWMRVNIGIAREQGQDLGTMTTRAFIESKIGFIGYQRAALFALKSIVSVEFIAERVAELAILQQALERELSANSDDRETQIVKLLADAGLQ